MAEPAGPFHLLRAGTGRFLCYCGPDGAVYVTDAMEVWAGELGGCRALGCRCPPEEHGAMLRAALGHGAAALSLGPGSATLRLPEEPQCPAPALALAQLPAAEARSRLQALLFGMAGCIESLQRRLEVPSGAAAELLPIASLFGLARSQSWPGSAPDPHGQKRPCLSPENASVAVETLASSCSPVKNAAQSQQLFLPDPSSRKSRASGSALVAKRKVPGESLINPGFKSKKVPSGVNFEDS